MEMKGFSWRNRRGSGIILALFAMTLMFTLGVSYLVATSSAIVTAHNDVLRAQALSSAEAGVDMAISRLMSGDPPGTYRTFHPSSQPDNHNGDDWVWESIGTGEYFRICVRDGSGIFTGKVIITSEGKATEGSKTTYHTVKVVVDVHNENVCVWNNVIFGGVGQTGRSINGNVVIRGSVHLLGDGESFTDLDGDGVWDPGDPYTDVNKNGKWDPGEPYTDITGDGHYSLPEPYVDANGNGQYDPPLTVTDLAEEISGTANVGNSYSGMLAELQGMIPPVTKTTFNGESVDSLTAKLRVKHGKVNISGTATVGYADQTGNPYKETMDGCYVSDGYGGNKGTSSVYSDNGTTNGYDLPDGAVSLPLIDYGTYTKDGTTYPTYLDYLKQNGTVYSGDISILNGTSLTIGGPKGTLTVDSSGHMTITGIVYIDGNISIGPSKSRITYSGHGTLVTPDSVYCHADVVPAGQFPTDALGLIARDHIELATGSGDAHLTMAIAMYAQHEVVIGKQCDIAGTVVSSYYSMNNVPRIYQVPTLADNLPDGLPGGDPIWICSVAIDSWQDVANP